MPEGELLYGVKSMQLLKEPLVHFLLLGAILFGVYDYVNQGESAGAKQIFVSNARIENISNLFYRTWQREPTSEELNNLIDEYVKEEIMYREGLEMGLDRDDTVVRRRIKQKFEFLAEDAGSVVAPTEAELLVYMKENAERYIKPVNHTFRQVFFSYDSHGIEAAQKATAALKKVSAANWEKLGDTSIVLRTEYFDSSEFEVARVFSREFASGIAKLPVGSWAGPIKSGYGAHLIYIEARTGGQIPELNEVLEVVENDYRNQLRENYLENLYVEIKKNYEVSVEPASTSVASLITQSEKVGE